MYISKINGEFNKDVMVQRDTVINANTLIRLGRNIYTDEDYAKIEKIRKKQQKYFNIEDDIA